MKTTLPVRMKIRGVKGRDFADYHTRAPVLAISGDWREVMTSMNVSVLNCKMGIIIRLISQNCHEDGKSCSI